MIAGSSYVWGPLVAWMIGNITFAQMWAVLVAWFGLLIILMALLAYLSKMFLWLPSLIVWFNGGSYEYSFGKWPAPGLYIAGSELIT